MAGSSAPLRVVFGVPFGTRMAGSEAVLMTLLRHRAEAGIDPLVVFLKDGTFRGEVEDLGVRTAVIESGRFRQPWRMARAVWRLAALLRRERPDVCVSFIASVQTVMAPAAALAGLGDRVVSWEHQIPTGGILDHIALMLPCAWVVACSRAASEANRALWPHRDGSYVWPGIDPPRARRVDELDELRGSLGLARDAPVIGIVGRLLGWKGQDRLIEALAMLDREVVLLVVGGESHGSEAGIEDRLRRIAGRAGVADRVRFCGHVEDALPYIQLMDVMVSASDAEPFGIVLLEAMAVGTPVLAVARGGPLEIVEDGISGMLVPTGAAEDLAAGVTRLLADASLRERLVEGGRHRYAEHFRAERMAREVGETLSGLASERRRARSWRATRGPAPRPDARA